MIPSSAFGTLSAPGSPHAPRPDSRPSPARNETGYELGTVRPDSGKRPPKRHPIVGRPGHGSKQPEAAPQAMEGNGGRSRRPSMYGQGKTEPTPAFSSIEPAKPTIASALPSSADQLCRERHITTAQADQLLEAREKYRRIKREQQLKILQDLVIVQRQMMDLRATRLREKQVARENEQARLRAERMTRMLSRLTYTPVPRSTAKHHAASAQENVKEAKEEEQQQHNKRASVLHPPSDAPHPMSPRHAPTTTPEPSTNGAPTPAPTPGSPFRRRSIVPTPIVYTGGPISNADILVALEAMVNKYANAASHELGMVVRNHEQAAAANRAVSGASKLLVDRRAVSHRMVQTAKSHRDVGARLVAQSLPIRMLSAVEVSATPAGSVPPTALSGGATKSNTVSRGAEERPLSPSTGLYSLQKPSTSPKGRRRRVRQPSLPRRRVPSNPYSLDSWFALEPTALLPNSNNKGLPSTMSRADLPTLPTAGSCHYSDESWNLWTASRHAQRQSQIHGHVAAPLAVAAAINLDTSVVANATLTDQLIVPQLPAHATMPWEPVSLAAATPITGAMHGVGGGGGGQTVRYANTQPRELYKALPQLERVESLSSVVPRVWDTAVLVGPALTTAEGDVLAGSGVELTSVTTGNHTT